MTPGKMYSKFVNFFFKLGVIFFSNMGGVDGSKKENSLNCHFDEYLEEQEEDYADDEDGGYP